MKTLELQKASKPLADYALKLGSGSIVITSNNKPVAALVSLKGVERESLALSLHPAFRRIIRRARAETKRGQVFSLEQIRAELLTETEASAVHEQPTRKAKPSSIRRKRSPQRG
jgi:PHD/YefM family antitoxin component YafN of YafNO toxin-antitoxin module